MSESELHKDLTQEEFERFRDYISKHSGIFMEPQKADSLRISLVTRATRFGLLKLDDYFELLTSDENEFRELMNLVTINETSFFRFPAQFEALRTLVIPEIIEGKSETQKSFRVWSAGCSTGEEPYTIAMTLLDSGLEGLGYSLEVLGTDVSTNALEKARKGVYPARALLNIPHSVATRFFEPTPEGHRVNDRVRSLVTFQYHNLIKEPYPLGLMGNWDVIFCRNVTIYFKLESTRRVVSNYFRSLNPGGYLFIGHSETLTGISDDFEPVEMGGVFLYRKPRPRRTSFSARLAERAATAPRSRAVPTRPATRTQRPRPLASEALPSGTTDRGASDREAGDITRLLAEAREASAGGRPDAVLKLIGKILETDDSVAEAYLLAAWAHADIGDLDAALEEANRALAIDPLLAAARYILGMIYLRLDDPTRAITEFRRTIYTDSDFALAHLNLGNLYRAQGDMPDACRAYENALRALYANPDGDWRIYLGGFQPDLLVATCERSLNECRRTGPGGSSKRP